MPIRSMEKSQRFAGVFSRTKQRIAQNLGIIDGAQKASLKVFRDPFLDKLDAYYESRQYNHLQEWEQCYTSDEEYISIRNRKPKLIYNLPKALVDRVASKLVGKSVWPQFVVEDDPDTTEYLRIIQKASFFQSRVIETIKKMCTVGSAFLRYSLVDGNLVLQCYNSKYCYPIFDSNGELVSIRVQYVYEDEFEKDVKGNPVKYWYKIELGQYVDILYDNPKYEEVGVEPVFNVVEEVEHDLGFVQGQWFVIGYDQHSPEGYSLLEPILGFFDEINYNLSQSSQAISYNQEPQLTITGLDEEDLDKLIKSSIKAWNLGKDGKAEYLETNLGAVERAKEFRDDVKQKLVDVVRVVMLDPEKIVGQAQSAKAMEVLHGPLLELIDEYRPYVEKCLVTLLTKMAITILKFSSEGMQTAVTIPQGYAPQSLDITVSWPPVFPLTLEDLRTKLSVAVSASNAQIISRETAMRWVSKDFGIENIDEELAKIAAQPVVNPFGGF